MTLNNTKDIQTHMRRVLGLDNIPPPTSIQDNSSEISSLSGAGSPNYQNNSDIENPEPYNGDIEDNTIGDDENPEGAIPHPIYSRGRDVYEDEYYKVHVIAVSFRKRTRYSLTDHLFDVRIEPKDTSFQPLILDLEEALEKGLIIILDHLKRAYDSRVNQNQIYITIVEKNILRGLNSGNYSLHTPSAKIARWVLAMLYNYLKSKQTLELNDSFKIQIKVLSRRHTNDLVERNSRFRQHIYH